MDARGIVYRSLRVPDVLKDENKIRSAAARAMALDGVWEAAAQLRPEGAQFNKDLFQDQALKDAAIVIETVVWALGQGEFDQVLGGYPGEGKSRLVKLIQGRVTVGPDALASAELVPIVASALIDAVTTYVEKHPFFDETPL